MRRLPLLAAALLALSAAPAGAQVFAPPNGKVFTGLTGSNSVTKFAARWARSPRCSASSPTGTRPTSTRSATPSRPVARLMLHISTAQNYGVPEVISPRGIARGQGDDYLLSLNQRIADEARAGLRAADGRDEPDQQRLLRVQRERLLPRRLAQHERVQGRVAALDADPARRPGRDHQRQAQDAQAAGRRGASEDDELPRPQLSMLWVPQTEGTPNTAANSAAAYWPGRSTWTGSAPTSTRASPPSRSSSASTRSTRASRSCSASGRCGAPTPRASSAALRVPQLPQAGEDDALQPGREPERAVPPELASEGARPSCAKRYATSRFLDSVDR